MSNPKGTMTRLPRALVLFIVTAASSAVVLSGCTSSSSSDSPSSAVSQSPGSSPTSTVSATPTEAASSASASADADAVTLNITIKDHQVSPNGEKINLTKGQTVKMVVSSDADDEIHAHTSGDGYELEVKAGVPATGTFVANDTGSFEVESHHLEKIIAILVVR
jgi:cytoskeletal protein RodZ